MTIRNYTVGVDIGGTNMVVALLRNNPAKLIHRMSIPTEASRGYADGFNRLSHVIESLCNDSSVQLDELTGIGVGCTGPIDAQKGHINNPYTLPTWENAPILDYLTGRFDLPSVLLNDAQAAALGEHWMGAGCGTSNMLYITVGTGVGGGIIINGHLYQGVGHSAGEIGHHVIDQNGPQCYCGARGCLETFAAAPAISRIAEERAQQSTHLSAIKAENTLLSPKHVYDAAQSGDEIAKSILHETGQYLGIGIANCLNILAVEMVVLGGGVMQGWDLIIPAIQEVLNSRDAMVPFNAIRIQQAELRLNAGVTGAARFLVQSIPRE